MNCDSQGNFIVAGSQANGGESPLGAEEMLVVKYDPAGNPLWTYRFADGEPPEDTVEQMLLDANGDIYVAGVKNFNVFAAKLSSTGELAWKYDPGTTTNQFEGAYGIALHPGGGIYLVDRARLIKLNAAGELEFHRETGVLHDTIRIGADGGIITSRKRNWTSADPTPEVARFDPAGNLQWKKTIPGELIELFAQSDNSMMAVTRLANFSSPHYLAKFSADGTLLNTQIVENQSSKVVERRVDGAFFFGAPDILELRSDGSRAAIYALPEGERRISRTEMATAGSNVYVAAIFAGTNGGQITWVTAFAPTTSPALPRVVQQAESGKIFELENFTLRIVPADAPEAGELNYQWFSKDDGRVVPVEGAINTVLNLTNIAPRQFSYFVQVSNTLATIYSTEASLRVLVRADLTNAPVPVPSLAYAGDTVNWRIQTRMQSPRVLQWYLNGLPIPGATNTSYTFQKVGPEHLGEYKVYLSNEVAEVTSPVALFPRLLDNVTEVLLPEIDGDKFPTLHLDPEGDLIVASTRAPRGTNGHEICISKLAPDGELRWSSKVPLEGTTVDRAPQMVWQAIDFDNAGGLLVGGYGPGNAENRKPALTKLNPAGEVVSSITLTGRLTRISNVRTGPDGDVFVGGLRQSPNAYVLMRVGANGQELWRIQVPVTGTSFNDMRWDLALKRAGDGTLFFGGPSVRALYSVNETGATNWIGPHPELSLFNLVEGPGGKIFVGGVSTNKAAVLALRRDGTREWLRIVENVPAVSWMDLRVDAETNIYISAFSGTLGSTQTSSGRLIRLNAGGEIVWTATFPAEGEPALELAKSGAIYISTLAQKFSESAVLKFDTNGVRRWMKGYPDSVVPVIAVTSDPNVFVANGNRGAGVFVHKMSDAETEELQALSATVQMTLSGSSYFLEAQTGGQHLRTRWLDANGRASGQDRPIMPLSFSSSLLTRYAAEVTTDRSLLVTADFYPKLFARAAMPVLAGGMVEIIVYGPGFSGFALQRSIDLKVWVDQTTRTFNAVGEAKLRFSTPEESPSYFYRAVMR